MLIDVCKMPASVEDKIVAFYAGDDNIDLENSKDSLSFISGALALGGGDSALCYTGTSCCSVAGGCLLSLLPNTDLGIYAVFYVDKTDNYGIDFLYAGKNDIFIVARRPGLCISRLPGAYESMYLEYINEFQDGFYSLGPGCLGAGFPWHPICPEILAS